jgi:uncharacterized protein (TIRG00374 family)
MSRLLVPVALLFITVLGLWMAWHVDLSDLRRVSAPVVASLVLLTVLFMLNHALGVFVILRGMGAQVVYFRTYHVITAAAAASYLGNLQLSVPLRVYMLHRLQGVPLGLGAGAAGVEALLWIAMMGLIVALPVSQIWGGMAWIPSALALAGCVVGALMLWAAPLVGTRIPDRLGRIPLLRMKSMVVELGQGIRTIRSGNLAAAALCFSFNYAIDAMSLYALLTALGHEINPLHLLYVIVLAYLAGTLSMIPMGLGTRDISFIVLLTQLGPTLETATAAAVVQRLLRSVIPLIMSLVSLNVLGIRHLGNLRAEVPSPEGGGTS